MNDNLFGTKINIIFAGQESSCPPLLPINFQPFINNNADSSPSAKLSGLIGKATCQRPTQEDLAALKKG
jgi:hypothetical protein